MGNGGLKAMTHMHLISRRSISLWFLQSHMIIVALCWVATVCNSVSLAISRQPPQFSRSVPDSQLQSKRESAV